LHKALIVALLAASPSLAECNTTLITLTEWQAVAAEGGVKVDTSFSYNGDRPIRMMDAIVNIEDVLGEYIGTIGPNRDMHLTPGQTFSQTGTYRISLLGRLLTTNAADIVMSVCVRGVVYDDGTVAKF
jgi:hypothetical protein